MSLIGTGSVLVAVGPTCIDATRQRLKNEGLFFAEADAATSLTKLLNEPPDVLLIGDVWAGRGGREWLQASREKLLAAGTRVVALLPEVSVHDAVSWLRAGASTVWAASEGSGAVADVAPCDFPLEERFMRWAESTQLTGALVFFAETPFEGFARFEYGNFVDAALGFEKSHAALAEALSIEEAPIRFETRDTIRVQPTLPAHVRHKASLLVIEDDEALRALVSRQLNALGAIQGAGDGLEGLATAEAGTFDVAVVDLALPGIDGWGVLRRLKQHPRSRETAIIVLSAHDELRETLKAMQAGARAYVKKSGRSKQLLDTVELLLRPRRVVWEALAQGTEADAKLEQVGPQWLLRAVTELDLQGRLSVQDALGRYEVDVAHGKLVAATAQLGSLRVTGNLAIEALLSSSGDARFEPNARTFAAADAPWTFTVLDQVVASLVEYEAALHRRSVRGLSQLHVVDELAALYSTLASTRELRVLAALREAPNSLEALRWLTGLPVDDVERSVGELLRRGVLTTLPDATPSPSRSL